MNHQNQEVAATDCNELHVFNTTASYAKIMQIERKTNSLDFAEAQLIFDDDLFASKIMQVE